MKNNHPTLDVLSTYKNNRTKVKLHCNVCDNEFQALPSSLYMKHGCPYCGGSAKKTNEQFLSEMRNINPNISIIGEYTGSKKPIKVSCNICKYTWNPIPNSLLKGNGCPKCSGLKRKTHEEFLSEMEIKHPTIKVIGTYINNKTKVECLCMVCGKTFFNAPHTMLNGGNGCNNCTKSRGENKIKEWLNKHKITYNCQQTFCDCKDARVLPFDFYLPKLNMAIEYDGKQHFEINEFFGGIKAFNQLKKHDEIKNSYCIKNGIRLLRIPYFEYDNIFSILQNELAS